ncbi:MAG: hypothetical protein AAGC78_10380 [Cellvibrio sp.]|uniref:hypothetical protein n=1 Tax=Cellvibrio sp. TaxID=1965322 RepID=UPI0031A06B73
MAKASYIGLVTCPICGNQDATVHKQESGTKKGRLYYRCYESINGSSMRCGTIQCIGSAGQDYINSNLRPIGQPIEPEPVNEPVEPIGQPAPVEPEPIIQQEPIAAENLPAVEVLPAETENPPIDPPSPEQKKRGLWAYLTEEKTNG